MRPGDEMPANHHILKSARELLLLAISFAIPAVSAAQVKAFVGARLWDGTGHAPVDNATLVVENGKISAIGRSAAVKPPRGAQIVDLKGKTITPGFINAHGHVADVEGQNTSSTQ